MHSIKEKDKIEKKKVVFSRLKIVMSLLRLVSLINMQMINVSTGF